MKRTLQATSLSLFALLLALGAARADNNGVDTRNVSAFHAVELAGTMDVDVTAGKPASVQVTGEADLLAMVLTTVKDGVLVIDTRRDVRKHNHLHVSVTVPELTSISLSGTGGMKVTGVAGERFAISLPGTGNLTVTGSTGSLRAVVDGTGEIAAKDLAAKNVTVEVNGTGQAILRASESLEANVTGTGSIEVHGHPARVKKSVTGVGSIRLR